MPVDLPMAPETARRFSIWTAIYGVLLIILGALAIVLPGIATLATSLFIGWLLLFAGIVGLIAVLTSGTSAPGFWWNLVTAVLYLLAGAVLLWNPVAGAVTLTIILAAYLLASGVLKLIAAFEYRNAIPRAWGWMLLSGIVDIILGALIVTGLPGTAVWVLGLLVGIDLLVSGVALLLASFHARSLPTATVGA